MDEAKTLVERNAQANDLSVQASSNLLLKSLILAQNERWRRGLGMQVERERGNPSKAA
jgi:hypothetical protein